MTQPAHRTAAFALISLFLLVAVPLSAQSRLGSSVELSPSVGFQFGGEYEYDDIDFGFTELEAESNESFGLTLGIPVSRHFQVELLALQQDTRLEIGEGVGDLEIDDLEASYYHAGILWQGGLGQVRPFVAASAGVTRFDPGLTRFRSEDQFSISVGGGVKIMTSRNIGFRLEGRLFATDLDEPRIDAFDDDYDYCYDSCDQTFVQGRLSAGLIFAF